MKRALTIALAVAVFGAATVFALEPDPTAVDNTANLDARGLEPLSETDLGTLFGARRIACTGDLTMARFHFMTGNPVAGAFRLLAAYFRPAICA